MNMMTIEQKAAAYDEAITKIKYVIEHGVSPTLNKTDLKNIFQTDLENIFPELKESEDIRKELVAFVKSRLAGFPECDRFIAWLGKQGQVKESIVFQHENKTCKENNNSLTSEDDKMRKEIIKVKIKKDSPYSDLGYYRYGDTGELVGFSNGMAIVLKEDGEFVKVELKNIEAIENDTTTTTEIQEDKDEIIREYLITYFTGIDDRASNLKGKDIIAWVKRQGEQKPAF